MTRAPAEDPAAPRVVHRAAGCLFATWKNVFIAAWTTQCTAPLAETLGQCLVEFSAEHPEGFSFVHVIANKPPLPGSEAREILLEGTRRHSKQFACVGSVLEGSGFWASAVRSFIVGIRLVVPRTFELQVYATTAEVAAWLSPLHTKKTGVTVHAIELERVLVGLRRQLP